MKGKDWTPIPISYKVFSNLNFKNHMNLATILKEVTYTAVRSGGPGGQHANKVSSKVVVQFDIEASQSFSEKEKIRIIERLAGKLTKDKQLILSSDQSRSQHKNKEIVTKRLISILEGALKTQKKRIPTKISKSEKTRRLEAKKKRGARKTLRKNPKLD